MLTATKTQNAYDEVNCESATRSRGCTIKITRPGWQGTVPGGLPQIATPNNSVLVIGRVLVYSDSDLPTAYGLARLLQLAVRS